MASILDRYGIKEVADITFYHIGSSGKPDYPVLYIDTAKTSTIEQTAEQSDAKGGKGNPKLITWDYGKEITVTLEDALFSAKSMAIMFGNGTVKEADEYTSGTSYIMRTETFRATGTTIPTPTEGVYSDGSGWKAKYEGPDGKMYTKVNPKFYAADGSPVPTTSVTAFTEGDVYFCSYDLKLSDVGVIEISGNSFPGTYYVTGDTYARSSVSGEDEFFQFIIPKAKVQSENTITLEAEGDPSVFNMSLTVLRPDDGVMMQLVKYSLDGGAAATEAATATIVHNHQLNPATTE